MNVVSNVNHILLPLYSFYQIDEMPTENRENGQMPFMSKANAKRSMD